MALVTVDIVTKSDVAQAAEKGAAGMAKLARQEELAQRAARKLGVDVEMATKAILAEEKAMKAVADAAKKAEATKAKAAKAAIAQQKAFQQENIRSAKGVKDLLGGNLLEASEKLPPMVVGAGLLAVALVGAGIAATALLVSLGKAASAAGEAKTSALSMFNVLSGGNGAKTLAEVDSLAESLGVKFSTARDRIIKFGQAGADKTTSMNLLKLTADLDALDPSGKLAEQAVTKVLAHKNADGTLDIKTARAEMELLAKQAGVAGDGAKAAAARFTTVGGALNSLDNSKTKFLESVWEKISPAVTSAAGAIARFVDAFLQSAKGKALVDGLGKAISAIANVVEGSLPFITPILDGIFEGFANIKAGISPVLAMFGGMGDKANTFETIKTAVTGVVTVVGYLAVTFVALLAGAVAIQVGIYAAFTKIGEGAIWVASALLSPIESIKSVGSALSGMAATAYEAGSNMVDGLIQGISGKASALFAKVKSLATEAWSAFKGTLGISSPSKAFAESGGDMGTGVEIGFDKSAPDTKSIAARMIPDPSALMAATVPMAKSVSGAVLSPAAEAATSALSASGLASTGAFGGVPGASTAPALGAVVPAAAPAAAPAEAASSGGGGSQRPLIWIENLNAHGGTPEANAVSVRRELEQFATALQLSRGY